MRTSVRLDRLCFSGHTIFHTDRIMVCGEPVMQTLWFNMSVWSDCNCFLGLTVCKLFKNWLGKLRRSSMPFVSCSCWTVCRLTQTSRAPRRWLGASWKMHGFTKSPPLQKQLTWPPWMWQGQVSYFWSKVGTDHFVPWVSFTPAMIPQSFWRRGCVKFKLVPACSPFFHVSPPDIVLYCFDCRSCQTMSGGTLKRAETFGWNNEMRIT